MNEGEEGINMSIEEMAKIFSHLHISFKKLLQLYTGTQNTFGPLHFNKDEIRKYLTEQEIEDYYFLSKEYEIKSEFTVIEPITNYKNEARLKQIVRKFDKALKAELNIDIGEQQRINTDLRSVILHVEMRPFMYLRKPCIFELEAFIKNIIYGGYVLGKTYVDTLDESSYWGYFSEWLGTKYESASSMGWCQILMEQEQNEERAFWRFFDEFRDYLEQVEGYKSKDEVVGALMKRIAICKSTENAECSVRLEAELENYPNKYAKEYYERSCYQVKVYGIYEHRVYGCHRQYLQTFYVESNLERIWVRYKDTILYQTLEEFLKDNEAWYWAEREE